MGQWLDDEVQLTDFYLHCKQAQGKTHNSKPILPQWLETKTQNIAKIKLPHNKALHLQAWQQTPLIDNNALLLILNCSITSSVIMHYLVANTI